MEDYLYKFYVIYKNFFGQEDDMYIIAADEEHVEAACFDYDTEVSQIVSVTKVMKYDVDDNHKRIVEIYYDEGSLEK